MQPSAIQERLPETLLNPIHIVAGLGTADRHLLAACLALFEDSTLSRRVAQIFNGVLHRTRKLVGSEVDDTASSVRSSMSSWLDSDLDDDQLRVILWMYLREAYQLPARLSVSTRGAEAMANELTAAAIRASDIMTNEESRHVTLSDLVSGVMQELMAAALANNGRGTDEQAKAKLIADTRERLREMQESDQRRLLDAVGAEELNDDAIRKILLTGGGLSVFGASVGMAGFSAYILAAQASAFIPLVSGPALVSTVAVLANPITIVAATGVVIWWASTSAEAKARMAVGMRVVALLALQGQQDFRRGIGKALRAFSRISSLKSHGDLKPDVVRRYSQDWRLLRPAMGSKRTDIPEELERLLEGRAIDAVRYGPTRADRAQINEARNVLALGALTLGDIAYSAAAIDPSVLAAADFSRTGHIDSVAEFGDLASSILDLSPKAAEGALASLKGYVAEQVVAAELVSQGHDVSFPESANQEGWDILVDGREFQVKWRDDVSGLTEHFEKYDYPVLANSELMGQVPDELKEKVFFVEGYSDELVSQVTERSVEFGDGVMQPDVPYFAFGMTAARNLEALHRGEVTGAQAAEQIILDGSTRAGLAVLGGYAGKAAGLLVFGPAGGLVLGSVVALLSQSQTSQLMEHIDGWIKTDNYRKWEAAVSAALDALVNRLRAEMNDKATRLRAKRRALGSGGIRDYVRNRMEDEERFLKECVVRLEALSNSSAHECDARCALVLRWVASSTIHPVAYQQEMVALDGVLKQRPSLGGRVMEIAEDARELGKRTYEEISNWFSSPESKRGSSNSAETARKGRRKTGRRSKR